MEQHEIVKLKLFNEDKYIYVAILKQSGSTVRVKCLKQPPYVLATSRYANSLFDGYDSEYGYEEVELKYENRAHTFVVHEDMLLPIDLVELQELMIHLIHVNFLNSNDVDGLVNKKIYSDALDKLFYGCADIKT